MRTLSPGINDPFTAITCLDRLGSALRRLAQPDMPSPYRFDELDRPEDRAALHRHAEMIVRGARSPRMAPLR